MYSFIPPPSSSMDSEADKDLSDLLDFSAMFCPTVSRGSSSVGRSKTIEADFSSYKCGADQMHPDPYGYEQQIRSVNVQLSDDYIGSLTRGVARQQAMMLGYAPAVHADYTSSSSSAAEVGDHPSFGALPGNRYSMLTVSGEPPPAVYTGLGPACMTDSKQRRRTAGSTGILSPPPDAAFDASATYSNLKHPPGSSMYPEYYSDGRHYPPMASTNIHGDSWGPVGTYYSPNEDLGLYGRPSFPSVRSSTDSAINQAWQGYHTFTPGQESAVAYSLPSITSFHNGQSVQSGVVSPYGHSALLNGSSTRPGCTAIVGGVAAGSQTGAALGRALASIYSTDSSAVVGAASNSTTTSLMSTPISSPPSVPGGAVYSNSHWSSSIAPQATTQHSSPAVDVLKECLDDAISVLRNHAELPPADAVAGQSAECAPSLGEQSSAANKRRQTMARKVRQRKVTPNSTFVDSAADIVDSRSNGDRTCDSACIKIEKPSNTEESYPNFEATQIVSRQPIPLVTSSDAGMTLGLSLQPPLKRAKKAKSASSFGDDSVDMADVNDDEDLTPEMKIERERVRRQQNNARERLRVRDINDAIRELGQMVAAHTGTASSTFTKLTVLQEAVRVITDLENRLRERNLNPKAACLKRREEEKGSEYFNAHSSMALSGSRVSPPCMVTDVRGACQNSIPPHGHL